MEPPAKRPRLSMFSRDVPPDEALSRARWRNDLSLKSRFEAIFEKYARDFTDIGDEIEVATGTVVVNNGHLEAMEDEGDTGTKVPSPPIALSRPGNFNGGSLLRAMTVAPEDHSFSFENVHDDVAMSIEAMAENAAAYSDDEDEEAESRSAEGPTDLGYNGNLQVIPAGRVAGSCENLGEEDKSSDEELFQTADDVSAAFLGMQDKDCAEDWVSSPDQGEQISWDNDIYSEVVIKQEAEDYCRDTELVSADRDKYKSSSPDSLFELERHFSESENQDLERGDQEPAYPELPGIDREFSDDAILDKFGPQIGPQVIDVLQKRQAIIDAHIEPAWRVPDIGVVFPKPKLETPPGSLRLSPEPSGGKKDSLWRDTHTSRSAQEEPQYAVPRKVRGSSQLSNESEDPLQEDFHQAKDSDNVPGDENFDDLLDDVHDGICPFCQKQFSVRGSVYVHWDELIKKSVRDKIHDMDYITYQRSRKRRRTHFPKVTVQEFHTMIKLREVDKLDWQEIYDQGFLGQRPATSLQSIYYQYRTLAKTDEELAAENRPWTAEEDERLLAFCEDPTITFQKLRKLMRTRPQAEIGNRLASIWMQEYDEQGIEFGCSRKEVYSTLGTVRRSSLNQGQVRHNNFELNRLRPTRSSDSMDSLFQIDYDAAGNGDSSGSDDGLFGAA